MVSLHMKPHSEVRGYDLQEVVGPVRGHLSRVKVAPDITGSKAHG